ncbi:MAG: hypothetical protein KTR14_09710 [Vampirovibrio sp.]|nr:hypothetical protein [Vampirovibrio sp.]
MLISKNNHLPFSSRSSKPRKGSTNKRRVIEVLQTLTDQQPPTQQIRRLVHREDYGLNRTGINWRAKLSRDFHAKCAAAALKLSTVKWPDIPVGRGVTLEGADIQKAFDTVVANRTLQTDVIDAYRRNGRRERLSKSLTNEQEHRASATLYPGEETLPVKRKQDPVPDQSVPLSMNPRSAPSTRPISEVRRAKMSNQLPSFFQKIGIAILKRHVAAAEQLNQRHPSIEKPNYGRRTRELVIRQGKLAQYKLRQIAKGRPVLLHLDDG